MISNRALIEKLMREGHLKSRRIIEAFQQIDRARFVPVELKHKAYLNEPLPIGFNQTMSQPLVVAFMLELLDPRPGERILEIGAGSGWKTALLAHILESKHDVGRKADSHLGAGQVVAIERIKQLYEKAVKNVSQFDFIKRGTAAIVHGDGSKGYAEKAPFDKIISAAAGTFVPSAWKDQVAVGGRIVVPIEDSIKVLEKHSPIDFRVVEYSGFRFVPLISGSNGG